MDALDRFAVALLAYLFLLALATVAICRWLGWLA